MLCIAASLTCESCLIKSSWSKQLFKEETDMEGKEI